MNRQKIKFLLSLFCFCISSAAVFLIPFSDISGKHGNPVSGYIAGGVFWLFLLIGILSQTLLYKKLSQTQKNRVKPSFFNPLNLIFGVVFILSFCIEIIFIQFLPNTWLNMLFIFLSLFSFEAIFIFSGRNYNLYIKNHGGTKS